MLTIREPVRDCAYSVFRRSSRHSIPQHSPPVPTKHPRLASDQPTSLSVSQSARREYVEPFFCIMILTENHPVTALNPPNRTEDYPLDYPNSPSNRRSKPSHRFVLDNSLKKNLFVATSNSEKTVKTKDVPTERQMAEWDRKLDSLYVIPLSLQFYGLNIHSTFFASHNLPFFLSFLLQYLRRITTSTSTPPEESTSHPCHHHDLPKYPRQARYISCYLSWRKSPLRQGRPDYPCIDCARHRA